MDTNWWVLIWSFSCSAKYLKSISIKKFITLNVKLEIFKNKIMRDIIKKNLQVIKKFYLKKTHLVDKYQLYPIKNEFKEWIDDSFNGNQEIWTLPDLTRVERLENFCRSIKKKIN